MNLYRQERRAFDRLKSNCTVEAKQEYEIAIFTLLERFNTTIYENRFVVGGAVEMFTCALLRAVGIDCILYGSQSTAGDLLLPNDKKLSIKASFRGLTRHQAAQPNGWRGKRVGNSNPICDFRRRHRFRCT